MKRYAGGGFPGEQEDRGADRDRARSRPEGLYEVGTPLDAKVSRGLLVSGFHPSSPIHDGAVIIKGNRIAQRLFLPITLSAEVSRPSAPGTGQGSA
jgi:hypothetical protein